MGLIHKYEFPTHSQLHAFSSAQSKVVQAHMYQQVNFLTHGKKWDSIKFKMIY